MTPTIIPFYGAILGFVYIWLTIRVGKARKASKIVLGSGGDVRLERAMRVHANFAEYVPLALILLIFMELRHDSPWLLNLLGLILLGGRLAHAYGMAQEPDDMRLRGGGTMATVGVIAFASFVLLIGGL
ncbi:MAG: hypothetical protein B7Z78_03115 [Rhodospirillales bacterium 20-60-12]|nr:MAG: hypothetical protein B7Z78_03115 [Rhodospirillales bacterium 20-60-12]HQT67739.1 MAPEG family protein [Acetobacteraceae bacterium]